ncbi:MAG: IS5 family transposase [Alphaproteobacteria bacterium]|nr:IS5 family transposase [Alphaproteobacteria bacterium]
MPPLKHKENNQQDLFRQRLDNIINMKHELVLLAGMIDWAGLDTHYGQFFCENGRPGIPSRMMIGLHILKHIFALSDEEVCARWVENPYFQLFCGEAFFQHKFPIERSSMTHWRKRVGDESLTALLQESLVVGLKTKALKPQDLTKISVDTTVQEKAVTFPTDAKLHYKAIERLGELAKAKGINLRQSYVRVAKQTLIMVQRYRHAKQMKRAKKAMRKLHTYLGRLMRDVERKAPQMSQGLLEAFLKARQIYNQKTQEKNKLLSWHAPEVECISKGKAHKPYEFGCKVSVITTVKPSKAGHFVLQSKALHGNPYDGHTLKEAIDQYIQDMGVKPQRIYVDKGYRGHDPSLKLNVFKSGQKRLAPQIKKEMKRRTVIEAVIGHLKNDGHLGRNYLKGRLGDKINAIFSAIGHNFRLLLKWFRNLLFFIFYMLFERPFLSPGLTSFNLITKMAF